jgi:hypothetical protein
MRIVAVRLIQALQHCRELIAVIGRRSAMIIAAAFCRSKPSYAIRRKFALAARNFS